MTHHRKQLERRTYSQDRYYILIKRQKAGKATFKELTELDEIVNRVPDIRDIVIRESFGEGEEDTTTNTPDNGDIVYQKHPVSPTFWSRLKDLIIRVFTSHTSVVEEDLLSPTF
jgi:hypothetical protein